MLLVALLNTVIIAAIVLSGSFKSQFIFNYVCFMTIKNFNLVNCYNVRQQVDGEIKPTGSFAQVISVKKRIHLKLKSTMG